MSATQQRVMDWPALAEIESANVEELLRWNRWLPKDREPQQHEIIEVILDRLYVFRHTEPSAYLLASRNVGWDF